ncbi:RluA family pseudouridine synthase [Pseudanabaena sp. FACHB-2040]|uniref:RluA family pseudouridine synthase n=1 Tax=Pseudanabaena sp. FACHB-2040 TaxID=2692859 RepID=UPI00168647BA|nr:RluA family pseudouridine synthase [Pseudanabaena sp. FACHB-2040]MBD2259732.1 RluA family pseudouridine synthase [Pseudanabaena sp. FACHB-2040]
MNQGWTYQEQVKKSAEGLTLLEYYASRYRHSSREDWQARIAAGQVLLNGQPAAPDTPLHLGQQLTYCRPPWEEPAVPLAFEVLYEDTDLLLVAKPSGLPVLPGGGFLEHTLLRQVQHRYPQDTPVPIHRLGRGTSGLLLLARSHLAKSQLSRQMRESTSQSGPAAIRKTYRALIGPCNLPDRFTLTTPIGKVPHPVLGYVYGATPNGLPAHSEGLILRRSPSNTLLEVTIRTGRPHQIRIHLAAAGYPLLGDPLYTPGGLPRPTPANPQEKLPVPGDCGYWLHAYRLKFPHPRTEEQLDFCCPPPIELRE